MTTELHTIPLLNLAIIFAPVAIVVLILFRWSLNGLNALYSVGRMALQLALVGFLLTALFNSENPWVVMLVLAVMMVAASWIALANVAEMRRQLYGLALLAIAVCGGGVLLLVVVAVIQAEPSMSPKVVIPLAGMIFAGAMNSISLAAERLRAQLMAGETRAMARNTAMHAAMIPVINSMFAVGLVSLPGMMTGQILSGVEPLIAVRYQVMVMCMMFGASGMSAALFLRLAQPVMQANREIGEK